MTTDVIVADKAEMPVFQIAGRALEVRDEALATAALIGKVENAEQNQTAVRAQVALKSVAQSFETARKKLKEPILEAGRKLDRAVAEALDDVQKELGRLANLVSEFQRAEQRRVREEEELQRRELERIEQKRREDLVKAQTPEQVQHVEERAAVQRAAESKPVAPTRAAGQHVQTDWSIDIINPYDLAKFHPDCVKIEALLTPIKAALNSGITVKGVKAERVIKAGVRVPAGAKTIDV